MLAKKSNRVYRIESEIDKKRYLERGFDIVNEKGEIVEASPSKTVSYSKYIEEVNAYKKKIEELKDNSNNNNSSELENKINELEQENKSLSKELEDTKKEVEKAKIKQKIGGSDGKVQK